MCERVGGVRACARPWAHGPRRMSICLSAMSAGERVSECDVTPGYVAECAPAGHLWRTRWQSLWHDHKTNAMYPMRLVPLARAVTASRDRRSSRHVRDVYGIVWVCARRTVDGHMTLSLRSCTHLVLAAPSTMDECVSPSASPKHYSERISLFPCNTCKLV